MASRTVPAGRYSSTLVAAAGDRASVCLLEFFASHIRNPNTRRAYARAVDEFLAWCEAHGVPSIAAMQPLHVAGYVEELTRERSAPTAKLRLAAIRMLFDWLVVGQVVPVNPAASVRGPSHSVKRGKTAVLDPTEVRQLLDAIDITTPAGLRDRALIGLMVYSFARIGAALGMKVEDVYVQNRRLWLRLHEKGGKRHEMPCHHNLETYLHAYLDRAGTADDRKGPLFRTIGRGTRPADGNAPAPSQRLCDDPAPRCGCRHRDEDRQSLVSGDRYHGLFEERGHAGKGRSNGEPCEHKDDPTLRSSQ